MFLVWISAIFLFFSLVYYSFLKSKINKIIWEIDYLNLQLRMTPIDRYIEIPRYFFDSFKSKSKTQIVDKYLINLQYKRLVGEYNILRKQIKISIPVLLLFNLILMLILTIGFPSESIELIQTIKRLPSP